MDTKQIIDELKQAAYQLGYEIRVEKGNFRGGPCSVEGDPIIMLNKRHLPETRLAVLAEALRDAPLDTIYLKPAVREALETIWADHDAAATAENAEEATHAE